MITRTDAEPLIPEDVTRDIIQRVPEQSAVMSLGRRLRDMVRGQLRMPVLDALPTAYWVSGDTGLKQTSDMKWRNVFINAEELAVIVPVPENVLADADFDIWEEVRPRIVEAMGKAIDLAILHGTDAPPGWPASLRAGAVAAGHTVTAGSGVDLYEEIMGENGVIAKVEEDGFIVTGHVAAISLRAKLRGLRDANGNPIFVSMIQDATRYALDGEQVVFPRNGGIDPTSVLLFSGDWGELVWSMRQDISFKVATEAVITDNSGNVILNTFQQDSVALRVTFRMGWALPNPVNLVNPTESTRYPFAVLLPA